MLQLMVRKILYKPPQNTLLYTNGYVKPDLIKSRKKVSQVWEPNPSAARSVLEHCKNLAMRRQIGEMEDNGERDNILDD
jgi:hypothetical protein